MELALLNSATRATSPAEVLELPPAMVRLMEGVERSLISENSRRAYRTSLLQFLMWCRANGSGALSRLAVLQYKDALIRMQKPGTEGSRLYSPATVNLRLAAVRAFAQEAADAGLLDQSEAAAIGRIRGEKQTGSRIGNWLQKHQVDQILTSVARNSAAWQAGLRDPGSSLRHCPAASGTCRAPGCHNSAT